ncbi:MAG: glutamine-hydrolyzing GMP synthase, partial [Candidatus Hydrogenedentes bacterium]|nr:glutamine-hydrolyzing GMP synthase [Candidatus Hydrogenedentota bacterium]
QPAGIIFSGGPASVHVNGAPKPDPGVYALGVPVLGICYGTQLFADMLGGKVERAAKREYGIAHLEHTDGTGFLDGMDARTQVWMSHGDTITQLPTGFTTIGTTENCSFAAIADPERKFYGVQFHPEVVHTPQGPKLLSNFVHKVCGCPSDWDMGSYLDAAVDTVRAQVGEGRVVCGLSGGVDSSVAAALIHKAIGDRLACIFVNNGLLRLGEPEQVQRAFREHLRARLVYVDASEVFLSRLAGVEDPEAKRRIIGEAFIRVFEAEAAKLGQVDYLVQGTLYPDVI